MSNASPHPRRTADRPPIIPEPEQAVALAAEALRDREAATGWHRSAFDPPPLESVLSEHADDLAAAAEAATDPNREAALSTLAALAVGEDVPPDAKRRLRTWLEG